MIKKNPIFFLLDIIIRIPDQNSHCETVAVAEIIAKQQYET